MIFQKKAKISFDDGSWDIVLTLKVTINEQLVPTLMIAAHWVKIDQLSYSPVLPPSEIQWKNSKHFLTTLSEEKFPFSDNRLPPLIKELLMEGVADLNRQ